MTDSEDESDSFDHASDTPGSSVPGSASPPTQPPSNKAPSWSLFRHDSAKDRTPDRIFLPIPDAARRQRTQIKSEPGKSEEKVQPQPQPQPKPPGKPLTKPADQAPPVAATIASQVPQGQRRYLSPFVVVQSHMRVKIMRKQNDGRLAVPWGVQYYLASLASLDCISLNELDVTAGINALRSESNLTSICALLDPANQHLLWQSHADSAITSRCATDRERQVYDELDRETQIRTESGLNGVIGPPGEEMRSFGGRVIFEGRFDHVELDGRDGVHCQFGIKLFPPKLGGSCRFSRRFGSENILRIKIDPAIAKKAQRFPDKPKYREVQNEILHMFSRTIQIMDRQYRPFYCKDDTLFYFCIGTASKECPDRPEFDCIWDLFNHHAPFAENTRLPWGKFVQRVQLGLSTSVPASVIEKMTQVPDIFGESDPETGKRVEMTDGAGCASLAVVRDIAQHLGYDSIPSAIQARVAGAKGVWYVDPAAERTLPNETAVRWIELRDSQIKIRYSESKPLDLSQQVVDLLGPCRTFAPSTLSKQIILVLQSNGVPISTFADMQRAQLQTIAEEVCNWQGPSDTVRMRLAAVVERLCKVESLKAKRSTESAEHRAQGMESQRSGSSANRSQGFGDDDHREIFFGHNGRHLWNGMPLSKYERAYEMLLSGFHPEKCAYLADVLVEIADMAMKKLIKKFSIPVARSAEAMVIPDPTGTLEEGEIQFRFSADNILDPDTRLRLTHVPEGEVLVTRHPCLLPTDVRKVRAVMRPELSLYKDVVVFSTKGQRPLASLLSGGDYDGDLIRVFWEPELVRPFQNADVRYADCPFEIEDVFLRIQKTVGEFVAEHKDKHKDERDRELIKELVKGAFEPNVRGLYGAMHLFTAWQFGTWSAEAVELAHKFCQCMDSHKTGLTLKAQVRIQDSKSYLGDLPEWAYDDKDEVASQDWFGCESSNVAATARKNPARLDSVLCALWEEGRREKGHLKDRLQKQTEKLRGVEDRDLSGVWREADSLSRISNEVKEMMRTHVKVAEESYARTNARTRQTIEAESRNRRNGTKTVAGKDGARESHSVPLRRVRSEAVNAGAVDRCEMRNGDASITAAIDDLNRSDLSDRLEGTIEVPVALGSASEVAARFCQWPKWFAKEHIAKMDRLEVERLAKLRASYTYSITYYHKPRFAFEMGWRWLMSLKAEASGQEQAHGSGSLQVPTSTLDLLSLRTKIIQRNFEMSQGQGVEI
ncbi:hypothetical protein EX895_005347 [Sporisorium graminicola]|uniref:RNA-dependent RNA polymerase n=1 Tax=Sporisorium graminicola TaxID=280036 RepID=A0A4U7KPD4_9BASI|nr:hypothetical protein EX895_005347 [Sporisorium graminicola]TKY85806.1 hypothetical protein EX895_005347 [Sporisorium graminicola]